MGRLRVLVALAVVVFALPVHADDEKEKCATAPRAPTVTWGATPSAAPPATPATPATPRFDESPVSKARELVERAKFLDEAAKADETSAATLAARLRTLRTTAKAAREKAEKAAPGAADKEALVAKAEELETDVMVTEAEAAEKRKSAADDRRVARELRARAVDMVKETPAERAERAERAEAASCDPPFRFTKDGRKIYRLECLK